MKQKQAIQLFEEKRVRTVWDTEQEKYLILQANQKHKMVKTTTDTEEKIDFEAVRKIYA